VDTFEAIYELRAYRRAVRELFEDVDVLLTPTTGTTYTLAAVDAAPRETNARLGRYTDYVNLLDLAAVAVPAGTRSDGLPLGVTLVGPADDDAALLGLADRFTPETPSLVPTRR
jgi:allophanate hydrolase